MRYLGVSLAGRTTSLRFLLVLGSLCLLLTNAQAQLSEKVVRVGRLSPISATTDSRVFNGFRQALQDRGWIEGHNLAFEYRFAEGKLKRLPGLAAELVGLNVNVILAGSSPGVLAAKNATATIPIVMVTTGDPVTSGLVSSLARPGGNITGVSALSDALGGKRLQLLTQAVPGVTRVAVLVNPTYPDDVGPFLQGVEKASQSLGVTLHILKVQNPNEFEQAFAAMLRAGDRALMVGTDPMFNTHRGRLVALSAQSKLPTMYGLREFMSEGGLMFYGASLPHMYERAAIFVDQVLRGTKPADLPVEQATNFELVINLKTAAALGLTIPPLLLFQAHEVIQ
jgi:putative ABC transport system substrate-binding protein